MSAFLEKPDQVLAEFETNGEIKWASELARIPGIWGVDNVYAELGTSFANSATANPRFAAALLGTYIKDMGAEHVVWGSDSLWYGSPQWQIEAFHRLEFPKTCARCTLRTAPTPPTERSRAPSSASTRRGLYDIDLRAAQAPMDGDTFAEIKRQNELAGGFARQRDLRLRRRIVSGAFGRRGWRARGSGSVPSSRRPGAVNSRSGCKSSGSR